MAYVAQLLSARDLATLSEDQFARIVSLVDGEILQNAALRKQINAKVNEALKAMQSGKTGGAKSSSK